jgi:hypothetical protein
MEALTEVVVARAPLHEVNVVRDSGQGRLVSQAQRRLNLGS